MGRLGEAWGKAPGPEAGGALITILHTNDVHSRIDPYPQDGSRNAGKAGAARRATLIQGIRAENPQTLLVDAGDVFQGTPYFNLFDGELDFKVMSALGYDAMTIGNHDFDGGLEGLVRAAQFATFDLLSANYDFSGTPLGGRVKPYVVHALGKTRVGLFGIGVKLTGLVSENLRLGVGYHDPFPIAAALARKLREEEHCALVVCLSHLGLRGYAGDPGDEDLARQVAGIDLIVGGHSHTFMEEPARFPHGERETLVFQVGTGGIYLGRVDFHLTREGDVARAHGAALRMTDEPLERASA